MKNEGRDNIGNQHVKLENDEEGFDIFYTTEPFDVKRIARMKKQSHTFIQENKNKNFS